MVSFEVKFCESKNLSILFKFRSKWKMIKLIETKQLLTLAEGWRRWGKEIAWTNGCFDLIHAGHVDYLEKAKQYGDVLIVGLNSDRSVQKWKNDSRPICPEKDRAKVLAAICHVEYILLFDDPSPLKILERLKPDFFIKGGDYTLETIDQRERAVIENYGGTIVILPKYKKLSTSDIIKKIAAIQKKANHRRGAEGTTFI